MDSAARDDRPSEKMLTASLEWSILQGIGASNLRARSRCKRARTGQVTDNDLAFLEADLRRLLRVKLWTKTLSLARFEELQSRLQRLCSGLDRFANLSLITSTGRDSTAAGANALNNDNDGIGTYRNLQALLEFLWRRTETNAILDLDLVHKPNGDVALFWIPPGPDAREAREAADSCNLFLETLFEDVGDDYYLPRLATPLRPAVTSNTALSKHINMVLEVLFKQYSVCKSVHEVLLPLSGNFEAELATSNPILNMVLSACSSPETGYMWHEAQCLLHQLVAIIPT